MKASHMPLKWGDLVALVDQNRAAIPAEASVFVDEGGEYGETYRSVVVAAEYQDDSQDFVLLARAIQVGEGW